VSRYYFDIREGDQFTVDDEGWEYPSIEIARNEAVRSLAEMAREAVPEAKDSFDLRMSIHVRDESGSMVEVKFSFEVIRRRLDS
jgi:hypothetical protein